MPGPETRSRGGRVGRADMGNENRWRPLIAILANPETRRIAAQMMLGGSLEEATTGLSPSRRRRATESMMRSGLVHADDQTFDPDVFTAILGAAPVAQRQGIERFVDGRRIRQYPANLEQRGELLAWVAGNVFEPGEILAEREVNERLLAYSEDVAVLRRYLVDYQLVERRSDGTEYCLTGSGPIVAVE